MHGTVTKAQSFQGCANASPPNFITTSDVYSQCGNNNGGFIYEIKQNRTFTNHVNPPAQTTLSQCGELTPPGWVNTKMIGFCGNPIQNSLPTQISPNVYQWVSQAVIRREIFKIQGLWPGYYLNVVGQFPVEGWITNNMMDFETVGEYRFLKRTIVKVEGLWPGYELNTIGEFPPNGWINMQFGSKLAADGFYYQTRAIKKISGLPTGTVVNSCGDSYYGQIPAGWVTINKTTNCGPQSGFSNYLGRTLKNLNGMPVGSAEWVVSDDPFPVGWEIDNSAGTQFGYYLPSYPSSILINKVLIRKKYSSAKAPTEFTAEDALDLENAEVAATAPVQEEGRKPTAKEMKEIANNLKISVVENPSNSFFTIKINNMLISKKYSLSVYDITGRFIESKNLNANAEQTIKIGETYKTGIYIVKVTNGDNIVTEKIIKQ